MAAYHSAIFDPTSYYFVLTLLYLFLSICMDTPLGFNLKATLSWRDSIVSNTIQRTWLGENFFFIANNFWSKRLTCSMDRTSFPESTANNQLRRLQITVHLL